MWDHIAEDSIEQADRWVDKLDEKFKLIATQALMGRARHELAADLRSFPFGGVTSSSTSRSTTASISCGCCTALAISIRSSARTGRQSRRSPDGLLIGRTGMPACRVRPQRRVRIADVEFRSWPPRCDQPGHTNDRFYRVGDGPQIGTCGGFRLQAVLRLQRVTGSLRHVVPF